MCTAREMLQRMEAVRDTIIPIVGACLEETKEPIIGLNTSQLYDEGVDKNGNKLQPYRSRGENYESYAAMKHRMNPKPGFGNPDLFLTGEFQHSMNLRVEGEVFEIDSTDTKTNKLREKYGDQIFGLTDESKQEAWCIVRPPLVEKIAEILQTT